MPGGRVAAGSGKDSKPGSLARTQAHAALWSLRGASRAVMSNRQTDVWRRPRLNAMPLRSSFKVGTAQLAAESQYEV